MHPPATPEKSRTARRLAVSLALTAAAATLGADSLTRISDLQPGDDDGVDGLAAAVVGGELWFVGRPAAGGRALYRYDGAGSPVMVAGTDDADPTGLVLWNGKLYFAGGPSGDRELWSHDPVGGTTVEAVDVRPSGNSIPEAIAAYGDRICFAAHTDTIGRELACWDGSGAADLFDLQPGPDSSFPSDLVAIDGRLYWIAAIDGESRLWSWNGADPPAVVAAAPGAQYDSPCCLTGVDGDLYFEASDSAFFSRLWRYDGAIAPAVVDPAFEAQGDLGTHRGRLVVGGNNAGAGAGLEEIWRLLPVGLRRLSPGVVVEQATALGSARGALFLAGLAGGNDFALYRHCGAGRVVQVSDPLGGDDPAITSSRGIELGGRIYFSASEPATGEELWAFDSSHLLCDDFESGDTAWWSSAQP